MTKPTRYSRHGFGSIGTWPAAFFLLTVLIGIAGCGNDFNAQTATLAKPAPNTSLNAACAKLVTCGQCFINFGGRCLSTDDCAQRLSADEAVCINGASGCNQNSLGDCLPPGCNVSGSSDPCL